MNEASPVLNRQHSELEYKERMSEIEGVKITLEAARELRTYFEGVYPKVYRPSGREVLTISFGSESDKEKVKILLDLIDILPWENELGNSLTIDSKWDIEKLVLMGIAEYDSGAEGLEHKDYDLDLPAFGGFRLSPAETNQNRKKDAVVLDESVTMKVEDEITDSVDEYIRNEGFYDEYLTELLLKETPGLYTNIDTVKGFNFLRNQSHYRWRLDNEGNKRLFRKKDGQEISKEERQKTLALAKEGDRDAMNRAVEMNVGLVYFVLNNMLYHGLRVRSLEDVLQEGMLALQRAIELHDSNIAAFSSYAVVCIEGVMRRFASSDDLVRIPPHTQDLRSKMRRIAERQMQIDSENPNIRDVAAALELDSKIVAERLHNTLYHQKLEEIERYIEILADNEASSPEEYAEQDELKRLIREAIESVTPRQKEVLRRRFGIKDGDQYDQSQGLESVGEDYGVTKERIRQIEADALRRLRRPSRLEVLADLIDLDGAPKVDYSKIHPNDTNTTTSALHDREQIEE
jgi:RNA polymerase sigma factor (sigma-70 family)